MVLLLPLARYLVALIDNHRPDSYTLGYPSVLFSNAIVYQKGQMTSRISPLIWWLIFCLNLPSWLSGQIICFGVDGHIALEKAHSGRCDTPSPSESALSRTNHYFHPCFDIVFPTINPNASYVFSPMPKVRGIARGKPLQTLPIDLLLLALNVSPTLTWRQLSLPPVLRL